MSIKQQSCVEALKRIVAAVEAIPEDVEGWMPDALTDALIDARQAIAVYESAPPECQTESEKKAFAFGWWKAMEAQQAEKQEPVAKDWRKEPWGFGERRLHAVEEVAHPQPKREWVGLTDEEIDGLVKNTRWHELIKATEAKLKAKNFA